MGRPVLPLVAILLALGVGGAALRSWSIGYPLFPRITERLWEARLTVSWDEGQAPVSVLLPRRSARQEVHDERFLSGPFETSIWGDPEANRRAHWLGRGAGTASYQVEILMGRSGRDSPDPEAPDVDRWRSTTDYPLPVVAAATRLAASMQAAEAARRCFEYFTTPTLVPGGLEGDTALIRAAVPSSAEAIVVCWRSAGLPARVVQALPLRAGLYRSPEWLAEVFERSRWRLADPEGGRFPAPARERILWGRGARSLAQGLDGAAVNWELELRERRQTLWAQFFRQTADRASLLARWSLYALPPETQEVFRVLLLVPIGALAVALLRNVVGFATFGTFMPVLIAIAFRETQLLYGLALFAVVVAAGYGVRLGIDRYKLLLVPRLSAILTFVIACLAALALVGHRLALRNIISVALLPMVILTMTIERFYVVSEESGVRAALRMAAGTAAVATLTYGIISWEYLQLLFFTYPELVLVIAAAQVALGRYVGFRLTEIRRFRRLAQPS
ncbi:MAG: hypothetical protein HYV08_03200 [Deltaproteobacteria bacterium]|nr:hypothetical protein [Deltaproteobacteria bacterium]